MSFQIEKLNRFIATQPAFSDVPFGLVQGQPITPRKALDMLQRGEAVAEVSQAMAKAGLDPPEDWELVEAYYRMLAALPEPKPKIYVIGTEMTMEDALLHIQRKDAEGQDLLKSYRGLLVEMAR
ncbi:unnamed protein product, partial [marine sediment metagenome]